MQDTTAVSGRHIRLTEERWSHIIAGHPELEGRRQDVLETVHSPDFIARGKDKELVAVRKFADKYIAVMYIDRDKDGFIITAILTSKTRYINPIRKRGIVWSKS